MAQMVATNKMAVERPGGSHAGVRQRVGPSPRPREAGSGVGQAMPDKTA